MGRRGAGTRGSTGRAAPGPGRRGVDRPAGDRPGPYQPADRPAPPWQAGGGDREPPAPPRREEPRPEPGRGRGATYSVVVMTLATLAGVGVLAAQAAATAPRVAQTAKAGPAPSVSTTTAATGSTAPDPNALPANSGSGARIVYAKGAKRVWLVSASNAVVRTMPIVPGTVAVPTGNYNVSSKFSSEMGTDGTAVQYVVTFGEVKVHGSNVGLGFDAVANVTGLPPAPTKRTGAVRMSQADAQALFNFSSDGTNVVVVS
jgi:hypothetical protein